MATHFDRESIMKALWILLIPALLAGCASGRGGDDYERAEARKVYEVKMGTIESLRQVRLEGTDSGVGAIAGGAVGGIAGSTVGGGRGSMVGAVLGAVAGGLAGAAGEEAATRKPGVEIVVRIDFGRTIAIVQEDKGENFKVGERVRILESSGQARVTR
jgi:outer membrane lipoprotein SlyB